MTIDIPLDIKISDEAHCYLYIQRGALSDITDRAAWEEAYEDSIFADYRSMVPWLPETCSAFLDVGGGMSGVGIVLARHYSSSPPAGHPQAWILDGEADAPVVKTHGQTFSNIGVARQFFRDNGAMLKGTISVGAAAGPAPFSARFDLVLSLQAWGFHIPVHDYIGFVRSSMRPGATLILDIRRGRDDYIEDLRRTFSEVGVAHEAKKFRRMVYRNDR
jgi:hypothetical protein